MGVVDFTGWATPDLQLTLGGRTYYCPPPSVAGARVLLALAARSEQALGLAKGTLDPELTAMLVDVDAAGPIAWHSLGADVYDLLVDAGVPDQTVARMGFYALHYWARGKARADALAQIMWTPTDDDEEAPVGADAPGGAHGRSRPRSGRRTV